MSSRTFAAILVGLLGANGCADNAAQDDGLATPPDSVFDDGKQDAFTTPPPAWYWANETRAEFEADAQGEGFEHLAWDAPIVQRLQFWADAADAALRAKYGAKLANVPKPQIYIDASDSDLDGADNALTRQAAVCLPQAVKLVQPGGKPADIVAFDNNGIALPLTDCLARPDYAKAHKDIIATFNKGSGECKITDGTTSFTFGAKCMYSVELTGGPKSGKSSGYEATSSYIAFGPKLIQILENDEDEMIAVIFHELGHYYRAHLTLATDYYSYFYALDQVPAGTRPAPDAKYAALTKSVHATQQLSVISKFHPSFDGADKQVADDHLGFYTIEQEADDFSLEVLAAANIDPQAAIRAQLDLGASFEASDGVNPGELTIAQCRQLEAAGWKDASGAAAQIPLGTVADIHHSFCFRAWNLTRELAAHKYAFDPSKHPMPPGGAWKALVDSLPQ
jgi:hypothetical protein